MDEIKKIIHIDMDAFYASVEQRDNPELRGKPVIVGGDPHSRGVVATCSYEARAYGIHSAMPAKIAQKRCPYAIFVRPRFDVYREVSEQIRDIFHRYTDLVEPLSLDEAFLDVTNPKIPIKYATTIAKFIKRDILIETGLSASAGVSYNKFLAKLASDWNKPNGIKVIDKDMRPKILLPLSISKIHGLGKKSVQRLNNMGIYIIEDLYPLNKEFFLEYLGKNGLDIYERIRGIDKRIVEVNRDRKSYGRETTLKFDTDEIEELEPYIQEFCKELAATLVRQNIYIKTITVKYKTIVFENHTRSRTLNTYTNNYQIIYKTAMDILHEEKLENRIRLIGVTLSSIREEDVQQLTLF